MKNSMFFQDNHLYLQTQSSHSSFGSFCSSMTGKLHMDSYHWHATSRMNLTVLKLSGGGWSCIEASGDHLFTDKGYTIRACRTLATAWQACSRHGRNPDRWYPRPAERKNINLFGGFSLGAARLAESGLKRPFESPQLDFPHETQETCCESSACECSRRLARTSLVSIGMTNNFVFCLLHRFIVTPLSLLWPLSRTFLEIFSLNLPGGFVLAGILVNFFRSPF